MQKTVKTISVTGKRAFTLLELCLISVLVGLCSGLFLMNFDKLFSSFSKESDLKALFETAIAEARHLAAKEHKTIRLDYFPKTQKISLTYQETLFKEISLKSSPNSLKLYPLQEQLSSESADRPQVTSTEFFTLEIAPDGSSTPAVIEINKKRYFADAFANQLIPYEKI